MDNKEKYIIDAISNHRESVNTDELWADLAGAIPQKPTKRRGIVWFWFGLVSIGILGSLGYVMKSDIPVGIIDNSQAINLTASNKIASNPEELPSELLQDKEKVEIHNSKIGSDNRVINQKNSNIKTNTAINESGVFRSINQKLYKKDASYNVGKLNTESESFVESEASQEDRYSVGIALTSYRKESQGNTIIKDSDKIEFKSNSKFNLISKLPSKEISFLDYTSPKLSILPIVSPFVDLTDSKHLFPRWSVFVKSGVSTVNRDLSTIDTESIDRKNRRDEIEAMIGGWQLTAGLAYQISAPLSISAGLGMTQIHERSSYTTNYIEDSEEMGISTIIHKQDGSVENIFGDITSLVNRETKEVRNNTLRLFTIPIAVNYRLLEGDKYKLSLSGRLAYSFAQSYSGFTSFDENQPAYSLTVDDKNLFSREGAFSYGIGVDIRRSVGKKWNLIAGFGLDFLDGIHTASNPINQKYRIYTLTFGISHTL